MFSCNQLRKRRKECSESYYIKNYCLHQYPYHHHYSLMIQIFKYLLIYQNYKVIMIMLKEHIKIDLTKQFFQVAFLLVGIIVFASIVSINFQDKEFQGDISSFYNIQLNSRTVLGHPAPVQSALIIWEIYQDQSNSQQQQICFFVNSLSLFTTKNAQNMNNIAQKTKQAKGSKIILFTKHFQQKHIQQILYSGVLKISKLKIRKTKIAYLDSDYRFLSNQIQYCKKIVYGFSSFEYHSQQLESILNEVKNLQPFSLFYTSSYSKKGLKYNLANLNDSNLLNIAQEEIYKYLYIFDSKFLKIVSPFKSSYYAKYTLQQMIVLPIIAITQGTAKMKTNSKVYHSIGLDFMKAYQFSLTQPSAENNSFCFVTYPSNPSQISVENLQMYLGTFEKMDKKSFNISLVVSLPYRQGNLQKLWKSFSLLQQFSQNNKKIRVRFVIRPYKSVSSIQVYSSAYTHCPNSTVMISSRLIIKKFDYNFLQRLRQALSQKYHYYVVSPIYQDQKTTNFYLMDPFMNFRKSQLFQYFSKLQIFKSDLLKSCSFWMLKSQQIDFYQTQFSFVAMMMESIANKVKFINKIYVYVKDYQKTQKQKKQIENVKKYASFQSLPWGQLAPYFYNSLENPIFRRNSPARIQNNIHQIWIGSQKISQARMKLHSTVKTVNKNFTVFLWTLKNITRSVIPLTYKEYNKFSPNSMLAMVADLLRYEFVLNFGGIYIDFKFQALKPLDEFLKYQSIFIDFDISRIRLGSPKAIGNGVMGASRNNYHIKYLLTEIITEDHLKMTPQINIQTGGFTIRKAFSDEQIFCWNSFGYHLFVPVPYEQISNLCGGFDKKLDPDQEKIQIIDFHTGRNITFGIPCKQYPQAYLVLYQPLAKTWVRPKEFNF